MLLAPLCMAARGSFTMWQIPTHTDNIGNSFVFLTDGGSVIVMDGGMNEEAPYLRGFLEALGQKVDLWIVSHPHVDHVGALTEILEKPMGLTISRVLHSRFSESLVRSEQPYDEYALSFYRALDASGIEVTDVRTPGYEVSVDGVKFTCLSVTNEELRTNPYNNSSMIMRVDDGRRSLVFLGDAGVECGDKVLSSPQRPLLDCDWLQVAHHGQQGCSEAFYKAVKFKACLWCCPSWVWLNNQGLGPGTGNLKTAETRRWMDDMGIKEHHVTCLNGLWRLPSAGEKKKGRSRTE